MGCDFLPLHKTERNILRIERCEHSFSLKLHRSKNTRQNMSENQENQEKQEREVDAYQVTKYSTEDLVSSFIWKLENFNNFPDTLYMSEKVDILNTDFFW